MIQKVAKQRTDILRGKRLAYNIALQRDYKRRIDALVERMTRVTNREILKLFESGVADEYFATDGITTKSISSQARILTNSLMNKFTKMFSDAAKPLSEKMVKSQSRVSTTNLKNSLTKISSDLTLSTTGLTPELREVLKATVAENVELIKSIATTYQTQVQGAVMRSITTGQGLADLIPALQKYDGMTYRRAKNISLDQTRKAYNGINAGRMQKLGVDKYIWRHSGGGQHPREEHIALDGTICSLSDPPIIDKASGRRGKPGDEPFCGCTMEPIIEFNEG